MMHEGATRAARLQWLLQALRETDGLPIGPREEFAAFQVLAGLEVADGELGGAARLRSHLKPLIAKSAREGALFDARFRTVYREPMEVTEGEAAENGKGEADKPVPERPSRRRRRYGWFVLFAAACLAAIWIVVYRPFGEIDTPNPGTSTSQDAQRPLADRASPAAPSANDGQDGPARPSVAGLDDRPQAPISWWLFSLLLGAPVATLAIWVALVPARARAHLRRMARGGPSRVHNVEVRTEGARELSRMRRTLALASRMLHSRTEVPSQDIDPERTVLATVRNSGYFTPVVVPRRVTPEYLVLVTCAGPDDHQADRMSWLVQQIVGEEVALDRYFIEHNANRVFKEPRGRRITLKQLFDRHPRHRLLVMGTGETFLRPGTQGVWPWADDVRLWDHRALATPVPKEEWGAQEGRLSRLFEAPVYSATSDGLKALGAWFQARSGPIEERLAATGLPLRTWRFDPGRWLAQAPADPDGEWQALRSELASYLDDAGLDWLRACAIYPSLRWDLTVLLGVKLLNRDRTPLFSEARATRLCLLPWFRTGFLPDWLRRRLIDELAPSRRREVTGLIAQLLSGGLHDRDARTAVTLPIEIRVREGDDDTADGSPGDDAVFLEYMTRQGADALAVEAPRPLAERLLGPRRRFREREQVVFLAGFAAILLMGVAIPKPWQVVKVSPLPLPLTLPQEERGLKSGDVFKECVVCPEMVMVPAGSFVSGSPLGEVGRSSPEGPQRNVAIAQSFAVGRFEVTFAEWDACVNDGGCRHKPDDMGWGRGQRPVINVSWADVTTDFLPWLRRKTGKMYRLLSEAEWEYAARAGATTPFTFGNGVSRSQAQYDAQQTSPVGSFPANRFGLHDVHGNVWEWVEDCWNASYAGGPSDGSTWTAGDCARRVLRGGSWGSNVRDIRLAVRFQRLAGVRSSDGGFRVARAVGASRPVDDQPKIEPPIVVIQKPGDGTTFRSPEVTIEYDVFSPTGSKITKVDHFINGSSVRGGPSGVPADIPTRYSGSFPSAKPADGAETAPVGSTPSQSKPIAQPSDAADAPVGKFTSSGRTALTLQPEDTTICLVAYEGERASEPACIRLRWDGARPGQVLLPRLRGLFVGINAYTSPKLSRLSYAAKDASDLAAFFRAQEAKSYSRVEIRLLTDANRGDVIEGLEWLERGSEVGDINLLFLAGHSLTTAEQEFYYMAADSDPERVRSTAVSRFDILRTIRSRKGAMIVLLDTDRSGAITGIGDASPVDMNRTPNELGDRASGVILYASSSGRQYSYERAEWGNGAFTKALIEGLAGKADIDKNGAVETDELDFYVRRRVMELTNGQQTPVLVTPGSAPEFKLVLPK